MLLSDPLEILYNIIEMSFKKVYMKLTASVRSLLLHDLTVHLSTGFLYTPSLVIL